VRALLVGDGSLIRVDATHDHARLPTGWPSPSSDPISRQVRSFCASAMVRGYQGQVLDGSRADARRWCTSEPDGGQQQQIGERRFAWALEFGVDALDQAPVLGHRCDNPLCQRIGPGHVVASSAWRNRPEWVMRRGTIGGPLRDARGARGRSRALRDAVRRDPSAVSLSAAIVEGLAAYAAQVPLWGPGAMDAEVEQSRLAEPTVGPEDFGAAATLSVGAPFVVAGKVIRCQPS
jgi:hypothetical protein